MTRNSMIIQILHFALMWNPLNPLIPLSLADWQTTWSYAFKLNITVPIVHI